jgi:hypothetical protein
MANYTDIMNPVDRLSKVYMQVIESLGFENFTKIVRKGLNYLLIFLKEIESSPTTI